MKVLRILPELDFGGVESRLAVQARLHDRQAYDLHVCGFHKPGELRSKLVELDVPADVLGVNPAARNPRATFALARYLRQVRPDIVHASIAEANIHALLAGPLSGVPVVIAEETGMPSHRAVARLVYRGAYRLAARIVGVSQAVCDYVREVDGAPASRIRLIYNCASPAFFPTVPTAVTRPKSTFTIAVVGRLVPVKNHLQFLEVLRDALPEAGSARVLIAGEGPLGDAMKSKVRELGLEGSVSLLGLRADVRELLAEAHLFALPSLSEGCSVSLIEAMASGVHVVGSDVPGIREVMGPLARDWTAPATSRSDWTNLLRRALDLSPTARAALAEAGQRRAYELFSPHAYVQRLQAMYSELSNPAATRRPAPSVGLASGYE